MYRKRLGDFGEEQAQNLLEAKGYMILASKWRCPAGELDIIAKRGTILAFVEVKTRTALDYGNPAEAVTARKVQHIRNAARYYMKQKRINCLRPRFDVIEIYANHIEGAF